LPNFLFVLFLSPLPFTTALAGRNYESAFAVALVGANYFLMGPGFSFMWRYATVKNSFRETGPLKSFLKEM